MHFTQPCLYPSGYETTIGNKRVVQTSINVLSCVHTNASRDPVHVWHLRASPRKPPGSGTVPLTWCPSCTTDLVQDWCKVFSAAIWILEKFTLDSAVTLYTQAVNSFSASSYDMALRMQMYQMLMLLDRPRKM